MFGLLDLLTKQVNDQIVEYAAVQSDIARRLWEGWVDPFHACQPVKLRSDRYRRGDAASRQISRLR